MLLRFTQHQSKTNCEKDQLRAKIGQLLWISNQTRSEISFDVSNVASKSGNAIIDIRHCNKKILKVTLNSYELKYQTLSGNLELLMIRFKITNASFRNLPNGGRKGSFIIFLVGENGSCNLY